MNNNWGKVKPLFSWQFCDCDPVWDGEFTWPFKGLQGDLQIRDQKVTVIESPGWCSCFFLINFWDTKNTLQEFFSVSESVLYSARIEESFFWGGRACASFICWNFWLLLPGMKRFSIRQNIHRVKLCRTSFFVNSIMPTWSLTARPSKIAVPKGKDRLPTIHVQGRTGEMNNSSYFPQVFLQKTKWEKEWRRPDGFQPCRLPAHRKLQTMIWSLETEFLLYPPWKLTCPIKRDHFKRTWIIFQPLIFRGENVRIWWWVTCDAVWFCWIQGANHQWNQHLPGNLAKKVTLFRMVSSRDPNSMANRDLYNIWGYIKRSRSLNHLVEHVFFFYLIFFNQTWSTPNQQP